MQPSSVFAVAASRLHADLMAIRLNRAGIAREKISAVFPDHRAPNSAICWMEGQKILGRLGSDKLIGAGPLSSRLRVGSEAELTKSLRDVGLGAADAASFASRVFLGDIVICVHTDAEPDVAIAWHTFRELEAEGIGLGVTGDVLRAVDQTKQAQKGLAVAV